MTPEEYMYMITGVINAIREKHPEAEKPDPDGEPPWHKMSDGYQPEPDTYGDMPCPQCGAELSYRISSYNGHIAAACETEKCVRLMQ